ncbi:hypothetical protein HBI55_141090 [Parastagonospora nodorum]|nr:hypothetical protein HBI55_141090 [Parastagonospora nodorum]
MPRSARLPRKIGRDRRNSAPGLITVTKPSPYTPINSEDGDIRLLELFPGDFNDTITMRLVYGNLADESRPYEALSYVWGTKMATKEAILNEIPVEITANLDCAIRHLRLVVGKRFLWIDAVSMNQKDVQERNHQVRIMGNIYRTAGRVIIWLGPVDPTNLHLRAILGAMQFHFSNASPTPTTLFDYACSISSLVEAQTQVNPKECLLDAIHGLIDRAWFGRVWVVQELALAKNAMIHVGSFSFPWNSFERFMTWLPHHNFDPRTRPELAEAAARVVKVSCNTPFSSQLCRTVHLSATDPRDKVFSIIGISDPSSTDIKPDYTMSCQGVFAAAAAAVLREGKFAIYFHAPLHPLRQSQKLRKLPHLPSWVPDLRITGAAYTKKHVGYTGYRTDFDTDPSKTYHRPTTILSRSQYDTPIEQFLGNMCRQLPFPPASFSADLTQLHAPGLVLGEIKKTSGDRLYSMGDACLHTGLPLSVYHIFHDMARPCGVSAETFVRGLLRPWTDLKVYHRFPKQAALQLFDLGLRRSSVSAPVWDAVQEICVDIKRNAANRTLFVTENGHVGLSYHPDVVGGICTGDVVAGLFGINFPFILRGNGDGSYRMVNVCNIVDHSWGHGFLRNQEGDAWNTLDRNRPGNLFTSCEDFGMREFVIV